MFHRLGMNCSVRLCSICRQQRCQSRTIHLDSDQAGSPKVPLYHVEHQSWSHDWMILQDSLLALERYMAVDCHNLRWWNKALSSTQIHLASWEDREQNSEHGVEVGWRCWVSTYFFLFPHSLGVMVELQTGSSLVEKVGDQEREVVEALILRQPSRPLGHPSTGVGLQRVGCWASKVVESLQVSLWWRISRVFPFQKVEFFFEKIKLSRSGTLKIFILLGWLKSLLF